MDAVTRGELTFDVTDRGPAGGPPVVLLHGFPQTSTSWDLVAPALNERGYRTLAMDQRGYSPGARPTGRSSYTLAALVADVVALIDALDAGPVHLVGHDWGAAVGWMLAAWRPEKIATLTALSLGHPWPFLQTMLTSRQIATSWYMALFQLPTIPERMFGPHRQAGPRRLTWLINRWGPQPSENAHRDAEQLAAPEAFTAALNWYRALPMAPWRHMSAAVERPTLLVWGDRDGALLRNGIDRTHQYVTGPYQLKVLTGVGHWIPEEAPDTSASLISDHAAAYG